MHISIMESAADGLRAGYDCPCGCRPFVDFAPRGAVAHDACCCGNEFAIGPAGEVRLLAHGQFRREAQSCSTPWGEPLDAVWLIGPSTHAEGAGHDNGAHQHHHELPMAQVAQEGVSMDSAIDPVCGMTVDRATAAAKGLVSTYKGTEYFFCGKGCKLDFDEEPERYLDPNHVPSM